MRILEDKLEVGGYYLLRSNRRGASRLNPHPGAEAVVLARYEGWKWDDVKPTLHRHSFLVLAGKVWRGPLVGWRDKPVPLTILDGDFRLNRREYGTGWLVEPVPFPELVYYVGWVHYPELDRAIRGVDEESTSGVRGASV